MRLLVVLLVAGFGAWPVPPASAGERLVPVEVAAAGQQQQDASKQSRKAMQAALQDSLRDFGETVKRIHRVSGEIHKEVNRRETIVTGPDIVDDEMMDAQNLAAPGLSQVGLASGFQNTAPGPLLPPRKRFLDMSMGQLQQLVTMLDTDMQALMRDTQAVTASDDAARAQLMIANDARVRLDAAEQQLVTLTKSPPYDNKAISNASEDVHDEIRAIDAIRGRLPKLIGRN